MNWAAIPFDWKQVRAFFVNFNDNDLLIDRPSALGLRLAGRNFSMGSDSWVVYHLLAQELTSWPAPVAPVTWPRSAARSRREGG